MDCGDILVKTVYGDIMENISHAGNLAHIMEAVHGFCEWSGKRGSKKELYSPLQLTWLLIRSRKL